MIQVINDVILWAGEQSWFMFFINVALVQWLSGKFVNIKDYAKVVIVGTIAVLVVFIQMVASKKVDLMNFKFANVKEILDFATVVALAAIAWYKGVVKPIRMNRIKRMALKRK